MFNNDVVKLLFPIAFAMAVLFTGCQVKPYAPPPQQAVVDSVEILMKDFHGRPEAQAIVKGRLTSSAAQLVDAEQTRQGEVVYIAVMEQTPRGATLLPDLTQSPPYETQIPLDLLGLTPGKYTLSVNGVLAEMEIPALQATSASVIAATDAGETSLTDALVPIEDTQYGSNLVTDP